VPRFSVDADGAGADELMMSRIPGLPRVLRLVLALATLVAATTATVAPTPVAVGAATSPPAAFVPVEPCRLVDTREAPGVRPRAGDTVVVDVAGECGVDDPAAVAAALSVTAVRPDGPGFVSVHPHGSPRPNASAVNYGADDVIANLQLIQLGVEGRVAVYTSASAHLVVDISGYFVAVDGPSAAAGRFVPVEARRLIDTRTSGRPAAGASVRIEPDVPADAMAVMVNLTTTATDGPDFFTAYPAGGQRPEASLLNVDTALQTRAVAGIVPISEDGFEVYTRTGNHIIVDLMGYVTGPLAPYTSDGLFVAIEPTRLVDTRLEAGPGGGPRLWDHGTREFETSGLTQGAVGVVVANIVATRTEDRGYLVAYPAGTARPGISNLNYDAAQKTIANHAVTTVSDRGIAVYALDAAHVVVDITGWFTGTPVTSTGSTPINEPPATRRVTIIGDSAIAGIRWNGALGGLQGFDAVDELESCRRLVQSSCRGREGYRPRTAEQEILTLPPAGPEDILVIATGYNDWHERFSSDFDAVVAAARAQGYHHIAWVDYRSQVGYRLPTTGTRSNYGEMNRILGEKIASGNYPEVRRWNFDLYTVGAVGWFYSDGVHETPLGSWGVADWISRHVRAFDDKPCVHPWRVGEAVDDPCPDPDELPSTIDFPDIAALYGL
jgi:hypothetical protein